MSRFTIVELRRMLETSAGKVDGIDWEDTATQQLSFDEIGYDSLALLELSALVQREYSIRIPDEAIAELETPASAIAYVNDRFAKA